MSPPRSLLGKIDFLPKEIGSQKEKIGTAIHPFLGLFHASLCVLPFFILRSEPSLLTLILLFEALSQQSLALKSNSLTTFLFPNIIKSRYICR